MSETSNYNLISGIECEMHLCSTFFRYIPFLLIILVKSVFEHGKGEFFCVQFSIIITNAIEGIIVCVGLVLTFLHANSVLRQQVVLCIIVKVAICKICQTNLLQGCKTSETQLGSSPGHLCQHGGSSLKLNFHKFEAQYGS